MFGRRKRETEDEDSLVPHGMVWQAMTEPEKPQDEDAGDPIPGLGPTVPPIPPAGPSPDPPLPAPLLPKQTGSGPVSAQAPPAPLVNVPTPTPFWRSLNREQATDHLPPESLTEDSAETISRAFGTLVAIKSKALAEISKHALNGTLEYAKKVQPLFSRTCQQLAQAGNFSATKAAHAAVQTRDFAAARTAGAMAQIRTRAGSLRSHAVQWFDSVSSYAKRHARAHPVQLPLLDVQPVNRERWPSGLRKVRIRFTGLPLRIRLLMVSAMAEYRMPSQAQGPGTSLRALATTALLAGVVVTGLILATQRYATVSLPSHLSNIPSASASAARALEPSDVFPASPSDTKAANAASNAKAVAKPTAVPKPSQVQRKRPASERAARPRVHHTEDDDYVARDTYVYYGNRPNTSR